MRNIQVDVLCYLIVALLFQAPFSYAGNDTSQSIRLCDTHKAAEQCGKNQRCFQSSKDKEPQCTCERGYQLERDECIPLATTTLATTSTIKPEIKVNAGGSSLAAGLLISTFLIVVGVLLYFGSRRYKWHQRFRQLRPNHYGNVLVTKDDDDDDDTPIA